MCRQALALLLLLAGAIPAAHAQPYSYATHKLVLTDLGAGVTPTAINNVGQIVGQDASGEAFLWTAGVTLPLGTLGGSESLANDVNDSGVVVGWSYDAGEARRAFSWQGGSMTNIGTEFALETAAEAINGTGEIAGWIYNGTGNGYNSMRWTEIVPEGEALFTGSGHNALGINDAGNIVGITLNPDGSPDEGYYWVNSGNTSSFSGGLGSNYFPFAGLNNENITAGSQFTNAAFLQAGGPTVSSFGKLELTDDFAIALGLNDLGWIVGESDAKGFLYDISTNEIFDLNAFPRLTPGFGQVLRLNDINNSSIFSGVVLVDGVEHGFIGELVALGDMDGDGDVDNFDIQPFELALTDRGGYESQYGLLDADQRGDIDGDGDFDNFDIQPFEALLTSTSPAAVPEPGSLVLLTIGLGLIGFLYRNRRR